MVHIQKGSFDNSSEQGFFRHFDFETDLVIPVVLVFVIRHIESVGCVNNGPEVLFLRRSFDVGAMQGQWSPVAGVDDWLSKEELSDEQVDEASDLG